jgi:hypothetical protein
MASSESSDATPGAPSPRPRFGTLLAVVTGSLCLTLTWARMRRRGRWWPWPVTTVTILAGWAVSQSWLL